MGNSFAVLASVWADDGIGKLLHIIEKIINRKNISLMAFDEILICFSLDENTRSDEFLFFTTVAQNWDWKILLHEIWLFSLLRFLQKYRVKCYRFEIFCVNSLTSITHKFNFSIFRSVNFQHGDEIVLLSADPDDA